MRCTHVWRGSTRQTRLGRGGHSHWVGIIKRNGCVKAMPIAAHNQVAVMPQMQAHTREGSLYSTDEWQAHATLRTRGEPVMIRQEKGHPVGRGHLKGIEGFWSDAKNWLYPYRGVSTNYFHLYLAEGCWRFHHRDENLKPLLKHMLATLTTSAIKPILVRKG